MKKGVCLDRCAPGYFKALYQSTGPLNGSFISCDEHNGAVWDERVRVAVGKEVSKVLQISSAGLADRLKDSSAQRFACRALGIPLDGARRSIGDLAEGLHAKSGKPRSYDLTSKMWLPTRKGFERVDVGEYAGLIECEDAVRQRDVAALGNVRHVCLIGDAQHSRELHQWWVWSAAKELCDHLGVNGYDKTKTLTFARHHDIGHVTGGHASDEFFKQLMGYLLHDGKDHESFGRLRLLSNAQNISKIAGIDDVVTLWDEADPLHKLVTGAFGADRIGYLTGDALECGVDTAYDPFSIIPHLVFTGDELACTSRNAAIEFLNHRGNFFETLYYARGTMAADSLWKELLYRSGLNSYFDTVRVGGVEKEFWELTDTESRSWLLDHERREVRELATRLFGSYHVAPDPTVAVLKVRGYEKTEPRAKVPIYNALRFDEREPVIEGVDAVDIAAMHKLWKYPERMYRFARGLARDLGESGLLDEEQRRLLVHVHVACVPKMDKVGEERVFIAEKGRVYDLFKENPTDALPFRERAGRMAALRVNVHPELYDAAHMFFEMNSLVGLTRKYLTN